MDPHGHSDSLADEELLHNTACGCTECFALLFHRYCAQAYSVSYRILRDPSETEDVLQEVFLSIFLQRERFDPARGSVRTWILQFAYFKALLRRRYLNIRNFYRQEEISEGREIWRFPRPEMLGLTATEWALYVQTGIARLGAKQRKVIELVHFDGYTLQEVAEILRETLANTRNYYYRGLKTLRASLEVRSAMEANHQSAPLESKNAYGLKS
jgi:RNA polymerase sigma-70 factor (ECF subfamily)